MLSVLPVCTQSTVLLREDQPSYSVQHIFKSSSGLRKHLAQSRPEKKNYDLVLCLLPAVKHTSFQIPVQTSRFRACIQIKPLQNLTQHGSTTIHVVSIHPTSSVPIGTQTSSSKINLNFTHVLQDQSTKLGPRVIKGIAIYPENTQTQIYLDII